MWYRKPEDLCKMRLLSKMYYGKKGSYVTRVPGGWIFVFLGGLKSRFLKEKFSDKKRKIVNNYETIMAHND